MTALILLKTGDKNMIFTVPCIMGTEGLVADELRFGGFDGVNAENGSVSFEGDMSDCARANITLRCGERVLIRLGWFSAHSFEALFESVKALPWENFIGSTDAFPVKGYSLNSQLKSVPACQSIIKKAVVERLRDKYSCTELPETGSKHQIQFAIMKDMATLYLDTSGAPLYKRGYKLEQSEASLRETLAASMVKIARYRGREDFYDPMCGSGTIAIEAAMASLNMAPGINREFDASAWGKDWAAAFAWQKEAAQAKARREKLPIYASDNDPAAVELTCENARRAGVLDYITVHKANALTTDWSSKNGVLMCDPPYGVRMLDIKQARQLCAKFGEALRGSPIKKYIISADEDFEGIFGMPADKRRKLYNGMIKCNLHMYFK